MKYQDRFHQTDLSRRDVFRFTGIAGMAVAGSALLAACATPGAPGLAASAGSSPLLMDHLIANVPAFSSADRAFKAAAKALSASASFTSYDGDMQKALAQSLTFPSLSVAGVHSYLVADASIERYAKSLTDKKIAYQNLSNRLPWFAPTDPKFNGYFTGNVGGPFADEAYVVTKILLERGGGKGDLILLGGPKGGLSETARRFGAMKAISEYPNVKLVANAYTDWDTTKAQTALETLLPSNPNVKFVLCLNDGVGLGALAALKAARNSTALICGMDGDPGFLKLMSTEDRIVATSAGLIAFSGVLAAVRLFDHINGVQTNPLESFINTDSVIIDTPEAAAALLDLTGEDKPVLWDATKMSRHLNGDNWIVQHRCVIPNPAVSEWGPQGVNPTPQPAGWAWPESYQKALDSDGGLDALNALWDKKFKDPYASVREKAIVKKGALGALNA
ncbi:substrate-binding domain-containing protein [Arthrobacter sp. MA-N2]|uniref:substrate-binding domain-containing protein n=1 Tax=Arthrobacter sp. MA-N2 TaxID=1101188 RepID=UPI0005571635|nr:substrate-binding domain-containing protein [Arthrobacter sp. MA-N2]